MGSLELMQFEQLSIEQEILNLNNEIVHQIDNALDNNDEKEFLRLSKIYNKLEKVRNNYDKKRINRSFRIV